MRQDLFFVCGGIIELLKLLALDVKDLVWVIRADRPSVDFQERVSSGRPAGVIHKLIVVPTFEHV